MSAERKHTHDAEYLPRYGLLLPQFPTEPGGLALHHVIFPCQNAHTKPSTSGPVAFFVPLTLKGMTMNFTALLLPDLAVLISLATLLLSFSLSVCSLLAQTRTADKD